MNIIKREIEIYKCDICYKEYSNEKGCHDCEKGHYRRIGEIVKYEHSYTRDEAPEKREGEIVLIKDGESLVERSNKAREWVGNWRFK